MQPFEYFAALKKSSRRRRELFKRQPQGRQNYSSKPEPPQEVFLYFCDCGKGTNKREEPIILTEIDHNGT
jgi:hypothetical protein